MPGTKDKTIFCSLDIETSDFDPAEGEVLEVGMVFFECEKQSLKILNEWESVFKPSKEVPARILALTGIREEELGNAPLFRDKADEIQELVKDAVIVGHNVNFDIRFLEGFGLKFSGEIGDTMDLAQILLPTFPSYNLESLMGMLKVEHKSAHRALADAKASIVVLEKLIAHFQSFPEKLQKEILDVLGKDGHTIARLLKVEYKAQRIEEEPKNIPVLDTAQINEAMKGQRKIVTFPLGFDHHSYIYGAIKKSKEKTFCVVPNKKVSYQLWKQNVGYPVFENQDVFNPQAFESFLKSKRTFEESKFAAKILVWQGINWQSQSLVDLNFSSSGNQFRPEVSYSNKQAPVWKIDLKNKNIIVDYLSFIEMDLSVLEEKRKIIVLDLNNFEQALTYVTTKKVSWDDFLYALKQIFDPSTQSGRKDVREIVQEALSQVDLFFGLAMMNWKKIESDNPNVLVNTRAEQTDAYMTIEKAADNFSRRMSILNEALGSDKIDMLLSNLESFFIKDPNAVRWVEVRENRLVFSSSPLSLKALAEEKVGQLERIVFTASLGSENLIKYFVERLGLKDFETLSIGQQELRGRFEVCIQPEYLESNKLLSLIKNLQQPAAVLMANSTGLKNFYEVNYKELQQKFKVFAQGYSGGSTKLLGNFGLQDNSLLLATDNFILKQVGKKLKVKELVITRLPFEQFTHPLFAAQAEQFENKFIDFNIPRALYNFHSLIRFFYSDQLERVYILDPKIRKDYGKYFLDYLKSIPFVVIK